MKKKLKRAGAALVTLALCAGMMPAAFAATEPVVSWNFNDGTVSEWAVESGWSDGVSDPSVAAEHEMLKLTATYPDKTTNTWKQVTYVHSYTGNQSDICEVTYDLYAPSSIANAGIVVVGADTYYQPFSYLGNLTGAEVNIGGTAYKKYNLAFTLDGSAAAQGANKTVADVLADMTAIRIFLAGGANASGEISCYVDNISLNKEAASEEPVGDYLYTNPGPVEMTLPNTDSQWSSTEFTINPAVTVYPGAVVEYDVTLANNDFTRFYTEPKFNWAGIANMTVTPSDLTDNDDGTYSFHFKGTYDVYGGTEAETIDELKILRIQFQNEFNDNGTDKGIGYNYKGKVKVTNIKVTNGEAPETTIKADQINNDTFTDGSQGWIVEVGASALAADAQWVITNNNDQTAKVNAVIEASVDANVRIGLVLTETAIGNNTITGVSLKY